MCKNRTLLLISIIQIKSKKLKNELSELSAAYNGKRDVCEILLRAFPDLINTLTVERWSPLHAACINGHAG